MTAKVLRNSSVSWQQQWPTAYPHAHRCWTLKRAQHWAKLDPETAHVETVDPTTDPDLPALASAITRGDLVSYRVGRRAVIATPTSFIKVVRPRRLAHLIHNHQALDSADRTYRIPNILASQPEGTVELSIVEGTSLHQMLRGARSQQLVEQDLIDVAAGLAEFHATAAGRPLAERHNDSPQRWIETMARLEHDDTLRQFRTVAATLPPVGPSESEPAMVHGDLHDKNVFVHGHRLGLIDLDGLGIGTPEDDVANLGIHLQLRALQGGHQEAVGRLNASVLYNAYSRHRDLDMNRIRSVERHTWFRLACVYHHRSASRLLVPQLLAHAASQR